MLRGVVYRLIEYLASMGHSSIWKLIWAINVSRKLTVGVHLSITPSISGPGSATVFYIRLSFRGDFKIAVTAAILDIVNYSNYESQFMYQCLHKSSSKI